MDECYYCGQKATGSTSQRIGDKRTVQTWEREVQTCGMCGPRVPHVLFIENDAQLKTLLPK